MPVYDMDANAPAAPSTASVQRRPRSVLQRSLSLVLIAGSALGGQAFIVSPPSSHGLRLSCGGFQQGRKAASERRGTWAQRSAISASSSNDDELVFAALHAKVSGETGKQRSEVSSSGKPSTRSHHSNPVCLPERHHCRRFAHRYRTACSTGSRKKRCGTRPSV